MENYELKVKFHAENDEDAKDQAQRALEGFDDGFEVFTLDAAPTRLVSFGTTIHADS